MPQPSLNVPQPPAGSQAFAQAVHAYQQGDFSAAQAHLQHFLLSQPDHPDARHLLAVLQARHHAFAAAEPNFLAAMQSAPSRHDYRCNYALALHEQGRHPEALAHFHQVLAQQPDFPPALNGLGNTLCALGGAAQAVPVFQAALQAQPNDCFAHNNLGVAFKACGQSAAAIASFRQALALQPAYPEASANLALLLIDSSNAPDGSPAAREASRQEARLLLQTALQGQPNNRQAAEKLWQLAPFWHQPILGQRLLLRPYAASDAAFIGRCFNDATFMAGYHRYLSTEASPAQLAARLRESEQSLPGQSGSIDWLICRQGRQGQADQAIGLANLVDIASQHRRAEFLIGIPAAVRSPGLALEAGLLVLDFAFNRAGLNKLTSMVYQDNPYSQQSTLAAGFRQEGYRPEHLWDAASQRFFGVYENGQTATDFRVNPRLAKLSRRLLGRDVTAAPVEEGA